ncbi:uncharacterized protein LOC128557087 [Mercenaria mercenaria]|uniref:uncharacterized protein LOC128557087 n=1 Tax=Mercenaria mercenaria TaxID=6596 RepID=UPI00234F2215|nr:uncharacterized protein LOC128557087 [Mercenaria mercenaria]
MAGFKSVQDQDDFVMRDLSRSLAALLGYLEKHRTPYSSDIDKLSSKVRTDIRKVKLRVKNLKSSERRLTRRTESLRNELACIDNYTKIKRKIRHELRQELDNSRRSQRLIPQTRIKRDQLRRDMERQAERNTQLTRQNEEATVIILSQVHEVSRLQEEIFGLKVNLKDLKAFSDANMTDIHYRYKLLTNRLLKEKDDQLCKMQLIVSKLRETQANCGGRLQCTALQCYEGEIGRHALNTKRN